MKRKRWLIVALCALVLFSLLACGISGDFSITVVVPTRAPHGPPPPHDGTPPPPPGPPPTDPPPAP